MTLSRLTAQSEYRLNPSNEIDVELMAFMERYATNLTRWDVLVYFGENPSVRDTARGIAKIVGRRAHIVQKELDDLAYLGILRARANGHGMQYALGRAPKTRRTIVRFAQRLGNGKSHF